MRPDAPRRTDPRTFAVTALSLAGRTALPLAVGAYAILDEGRASDLVTYFLPLVFVLIGINLLVAYLRWTRLTYTVGEEDIRVESGLLSRAARSVPFERIQDVSLEQKLLARVFGLVEVRFETGAGGGDDLKLAYLSENEGERLRETVRARREGVGEEPVAADAAQSSVETRVLFEMSPRRIVTFGLFEFSLAAVAVIGGAAQQFDFLLPFDIWDVDLWQDRLAGSGHWLTGLGPWMQAVGIALAILSLGVLGFGTGLVRTVLREWDFLLERTDKGLRRRRGLLTRTDLVMPFHRVQALKIGTGILRRRFGWYSLKVVSLASDSGSANHDAAPFAQMREIEPIVRETGFELPSTNTDWHRGSKRYRVDRYLLGLALLAGISLAGLATGQFAMALPVAFLAACLLGFYEFFRWRWDCHAIDQLQVYSRHGWLAPSLSIGSRVKLQSVEIRRGPLARIRGYADLILGLAGGRLRMRGLPAGQARALSDDLLESMAQLDFSETMERSGSSASTPREITPAIHSTPGVA